MRFETGYISPNCQTQGPYFCTCPYDQHFLCYLMCIPILPNYLDKHSGRNGLTCHHNSIPYWILWVGKRPKLAFLLAKICPFPMHIWHICLFFHGKITKKCAIVVHSNIWKTCLAFLVKGTFNVHVVAWSLHHYYAIRIGPILYISLFHICIRASDLPHFIIMLVCFYS